MSKQIIGRVDVAADANNAANYILLNKFVASASGAIDTIKIRCSNTVNVKIGLYSDTGGAPDALLNSVGSTACILGVNSIAFPSTPIIRGLTYWLATNSDSNKTSTKIETNVRKYKALAFASAFPDPAGTGYSGDTSYTIIASGWSETQIKSINGLALASVKSRNGLAIADIKSINGLA